MSNENVPSPATVHDAVRRHYGRAAATVLSGKGPACCGPAVEDDGKDPITDDLYAPHEVEGIPKGALDASLGCANPTALAGLNEGEVVLDLGSGGGIDVLLSARRVGPSGFVYGLDMTDQMLELAEQNRSKAGVENAKFLKGNIESIPLPDESVDVIISNCVINLSPDKDKVLREAFRVLRPKGRFAVADIVAEEELPEALKRDLEAHAGCIAGALSRDEYRAKLAQAGFEAIQVEVVRSFSLGDLGAASCCGDSGTDGGAEGALLHSAFVRALKPARPE